jgi:hypothetical protein
VRAENEGGGDNDEEEGTAPQQVPEQYASAAYSTHGVGGGRGERVETVEKVGRSLGLLAGGGRNEDIFRAITSFRTLTASSVRKHVIVQFAQRCQCFGFSKPSLSGIHLRITLLTMSHVGQTALTTNSVISKLETY